MIRPYDEVLRHTAALATAAAAAKDAESVAHAYQETVNRVVRDVKVAYFELATIADFTTECHVARAVGFNAPQPACAISAAPTS